MTKIVAFKKYFVWLLISFVFAAGCNYVSYRTVVYEPKEGENIDPEPDYDITLNESYQDVITFMFLGNRAEVFGTYFNKFYMANEDYEAAMTDYRTSTIAAYNRRLDSLNITPPVSTTAKELLTKVITRCSKIIQYNKSTRFLDDAVLLIGKSYYYEGEYYEAERKFNEFLSKLTKSELYDEAILFLGKTKLKLGNNTDAETILLNLFKTTKNNEIKSEITQDLAALAIMKRNYPGAVEYFGSSIELTNDKEKKAEKQYILAKIYSRYKPEEAPLQYKKANDLTSDFDLTFYSRLNEAKSLNVIGKTSRSFEMLDNMNSKYRDYPDYKQLVELEIANTMLLEKKYSEARIKYFDIIIDYPSSKSAADAYYHLADYSEKVKNNYLFAYVNYKKVSEINALSDFASISLYRTASLDKYFTLLSVIKDTTKILYPDNEPEFLSYKLKREKEKGIDQNREHQNPKGSEQPGPKGGGYKSFSLIDSIDLKDTSKLKVNPETEINPETGEIKSKLTQDSVVIKNSPDTNKTLADTTKKDNTKDTVTTIKEEVKQLTHEDSVRIAEHIQDSIKTSKQLLKVDAYFQLSELFLYDLNRVDSAEYYLNIIIEDSINPDRTARALYALANIYKNKKDEVRAAGIYKRIVSQFPESTFANESRRLLGMEVVNYNIDSAEIIYHNAESKMLKKDYASALADLQRIVSNYPADSFYVKSLYSIGWIYENGFNNKDSSLAYYKKLKTSFPYSIYTISVTPKIDFYTLWDKRDTTNKILDSLGVLPDSLKAIYDSLYSVPDSGKIKQELLEKEKSKAPKGGRENQQTGENPPIEEPKGRK